MPDLLQNLTDLATYRHSDMSVALDARDEIERLNAQALSLACEISKSRRERDEARARIEAASVLMDRAFLYGVDADLKRDMDAWQRAADQPTVSEK